MVFLGIWINNERTPASKAVHTNIIIGVGGFTSANIGANIVASLAPRLHKPKAVPAKIAGKI